MSSLLPITKSPFNWDGKFLCFYINATRQIQVLRIANIPNFSWEKVVFPVQRLFFEAREEARLEIHTPEKVTSILADVIPCQQLQIAVIDMKKCAYCSRLLLRHIRSGGIYWFCPS